MANPVISGLSFSASDSTIVGSWTTDISSDSNMTAGGKAAIDNGYQTAVTTHICIVTGLLPSQTYSCIVTSGATSSTPQAITTSTQHLSQPIQRVTDNGSRVLSSNHGDDCPTFVSSDTKTYILEDDGFGFVNATPNAGANMQVGVLTTDGTLVGTTVNLLTAYGAWATSNGTDGPGGSPLSNKTTGLIGFSGELYAFQNRSYNPAAGHPYSQEYFGNIMKSTDKGATWNSWQAPAVFNANGIPPSPLGSFQFDSGNIGAIMPIRYAVDDGTIGYLTAGNRFDGGDGYIYMNFVDTLLQNADNLWLMRMPRYAVQAQDATKVQYWKGPASPSQAAFVNDSNWAAGYTGLTAILSDAGKICWSDTIFVPTLNRYLLQRWYYPITLAAAVQSDSTVWAFMEGPTPAGPWTSVFTQTYRPQGFDTVYAMHRTAAAASTIVDITFNIIHSGDYVSSGTGPYYFPTNSTFTLNKTATAGVVQLVQDNFIRASIGSNWTQVDSGTLGALAITSNLCVPGTAATNSMMFWNAGDGTPDGGWAADQYSEGTVGVITASGFIGPAVRCTATGGYIAAVQGGSDKTFTFYKRASGAFTSLTTVLHITCAAGDVFRLGVVGTTFTFYKNGVSFGTLTDATFASGSPGLYIEGTLVTDTQTALWAAGSTQCALPTFSPVAGAYSSTQTVTITGTASSTIYYTTDGTNPTHASSSIASGATISVAASKTVKAVSSKSNNADSPIGQATFTLPPVAGAGNAGSLSLRRRKRRDVIS